MVRFRKSIIVFLVTSVMLLASCSAGSYKIIKGDISFNKDSVFGSYDEFSGYKFTSIKLEEGSTISLDLEVKTEEGSLIAKVLDSEDNELLNINDENEDQERELFIENTGTYKIRVEGNKHKGEFSLGWDIK